MPTPLLVPMVFAAIVTVLFGDVGLADVVDVLAIIDVVSEAAVVAGNDVVVATGVVVADVVVVSTLAVGVLTVDRDDVVTVGALEKVVIIVDDVGRVDCAVKFRLHDR
jgi:hypothetical protein